MLVDTEKNFNDQTFFNYLLKVYHVFLLPYLFQEYDVFNEVLINSIILLHGVED